MGEKIYFFKLKSRHGDTQREKEKLEWGKEKDTLTKKMKHWTKKKERNIEWTINKYRSKQNYQLNKERKQVRHQETKKKKNRERRQ